MSAPSIFIAPASTDQLEDAIEAGGGVLADDPANADAIVWINPRDPGGLKQLLQGSKASWVQLPFAGIEKFVEAGVIDPSRTWTCTKGVYGPACAEHVVALMLAAARLLHVHARAHGWREGGFGSPERRLRGTTAVIVGTGGIGRALVPMLRPLEVRMIGVNRSGSPLEGAERTLPVTELDDVLDAADWLVLAAASTPETKALVDARRLSLLKPSAWVVNVARGELIDTPALVEALRESRVGGAALDVTDPEPLPDDHPLWELPNALITPHVANTWDMAVPELISMVRRNVAAFARGGPLEGLVDPLAGY